MRGACIVVKDSGTGQDRRRRRIIVMGEGGMKAEDSMMGERLRTEGKKEAPATCHCVTILILISKLLH